MNPRAGRRRFFLDRMLRRQGAGTGSKPALLMKWPLRQIVHDSLENILGVPYAGIGGVATRMYIPERMTLDLDVLITLDDMPSAIKRLQERQATAAGTLAFPDSRLGLVGETWHIEGMAPLDVIAATGHWVTEALEGARIDETGLRIAPRATLVALKLDASRGIDQGDLTRLLGSANDVELQSVRTLVAALFPEDVEDLESYITLGRLEFGGEPLAPRGSSSAPEASNPP